jgi:flagellar FliJ protein
MKGIDTLIRLSKRALDELRKKQVALETQKAKLEQGIKNLANELLREQQLAAKSPEMGSFYGGFAKSIKERQQKLHQEIINVDLELSTLSEEVMVAFADLKKYEIARDNAKARKKAEEARRETIAMDEVAATRYTRQMKEETK